MTTSSYLVGRLAGLSTATVVVLIGLFLVASWAVSYAVGGAGVVPPHWFYVPILFAAVRFRWRGALVTGLIAGVLSGPLLPESVATHTAQALGNWTGRTVFFVALGLLMASLISVALNGLSRQVETLRAARTLALALHRGEFVVWYQPVIDLSDRSIVGVEALVRWNHPSRGLLLPADFIGTAEESGTIGALGAYVLDEACAQVAAWRTSVLEGVPCFKLAVNLSSLQLVEPGLEATVLSALRETGLPASWLCLEITETAVMEDIERSAERLTRLKGVGVNLAIDDFGVGHSSLAYLHRLPVDIVKIDQSFVAALGKPGQHGAMAGALIALAHTLDMRTIAEGVETPSQAHELAELGAELAQGFLFCRPQPASSIGPLLERQRAAHQLAGAEPSATPAANPPTIEPGRPVPTRLR
jgi:EAL domain-containing protein (putative c-di-GMP-specific phosphodiesterase class I)